MMENANKVNSAALVVKWKPVRAEKVIKGKEGQREEEDMVKEKKGNKRKR